MALKIQNGGDNIEVRFDHVHANELPLLMQKLYHHANGCMEFEDNYETRCTIATIMLNDNPIISGFSFCSPVDNFCKSFGRKLSLFRAIKALRTNGNMNGLLMHKDLSRRIWEEYHQSCK